MQKNRPHSHIRLLLILMVTSFVSMGCTKEDLSQCPTFSHEFIVRAYDIDGNNISQSDDVKEITAYVFDDQDNFLALRQIELEKNIKLNYPNNSTLHIVVLGNSANDKQKTPTLTIGDKLVSACISLTMRTSAKSMQQTANSPDDLFKGRKEIVKSISNTLQEIAIRRKVGSVVITTKGLKAYTNTTSDDFHYVLRYGKRQLNFMGHTLGEKALHNPKAKFNNGLFESSIFNILPPTESNIMVDIYNGISLVATIAKDSNGNPLIVETGELLNIYANFTSNINVSIEVTSWGEKKIWKEF